MSEDELISVLKHATRFKPVALLAVCAAEMTRLKSPQEQAVGFRLIAVLAAASADHLEAQKPDTPETATFA